MKGPRTMAKDKKEKTFTLDDKPIEAPYVFSEKPSKNKKPNKPSNK